MYISINLVNQINVPFSSTIFLIDQFFYLYVFNQTLFNLTHRLTGRKTPTYYPNWVGRFNSNGWSNNTFRWIDSRSFDIKVLTATLVQYSDSTLFSLISKPWYWAEAVLKPGPFASQTGSRVHYEFVSVQPTNRPVNKEYNKEKTIAQLLGKKWFLWWNCRSNICDKHPKSESCRRLFGWCCYRAYRLITTEWNAKRIYVKDAKISYQFMSGNFAFIFNTLHCEAYRRDGLVTFQTQLQKLHTSATFCRHLLQKLDYC